MTGRFEGERAVVVGAGVSGVASVRALLREGATVRVSDERPLDRLPAAEELSALGAEVFAGGHEPWHLKDATIVVASPGVPETAPILLWAAEGGISVWGELELGALICEVPYLAVTGTNGKTTTTALIASMLRSAGIDAIECGNIGHPFPSAAGEGHEALVVEASSFQLRFHENFHPQVSVLLNVAPDHLDWHGSQEAYAAAKARIFLCQSGEDVHVGNAEDPAAAEISRRAGCELVWFSASAEPGPGEIGYVDGELVSRIKETQRLGRPGADRAGSREDSAAAAAAALSFGVAPEAIATALQTFTPASHRGETVATLGGVRFVDNSKATNVHAALAAVAAFDDVVLIAGGRSKGVSLSELTRASDRLRGLVAIGEAADELVASFDPLIPTRKAGSIEEAVGVAFELAGPTSTILLAPACASWDMFEDYVERGERFASAARSLTSSREGAHG